ncbi:MAG: ParA family protein [Hahellaceae bacterium]|nr:ParA family protein [Hahellaceae bacterium]
MKTIAFYNLKGGVGKTSCAVNTAFYAAASGIPTLLWDLDPQGSASWHFEATHNKDVKLTKLLKGKMPIGSLITHTAYQNLDIIASDLSFRNLDFKTRQNDISNLISEWSELFKEDYALLILDCAPSLSTITESIFDASSHIFVPLIPAPLSIQTYRKILEFFDSKNIKTKKLHPLLSMVDRRKAMHKEFLANQLGEFDNLLKGYIPYSSDAEKMSALRRPIETYAPRSAANLAFRLMWEQIRKIAGI